MLHIKFKDVVKAIAAAVLCLTVSVGVVLSSTAVAAGHPHLAQDIKKQVMCLVLSLEMKQPEHKTQILFQRIKATDLVRPNALYWMGYGRGLVFAYAYANRTKMPLALGKIEQAAKLYAYTGCTINEEI